MTTQQPDQITHEQFSTMSDAEILRARRLGLLDGLTGTPAQLTQADLEAMSAEQIAAAHARGATAVLTGARPPRPNPAQRGTGPHGPDPLVQLDKDDLVSMSPDEIVAATKDGRLGNLLGMSPRPSIDPRP